MEENNTQKPCYISTLETTGDGVVEYFALVEEIKVGSHPHVDLQLVKQGAPRVPPVGVAHDAQNAV